VKPNYLLRAATGRLAACGVGSPRVDAELLLAHVLRIPRSALATAQAVSPDECSAFEAALERRLQREPLQYILGSAPFRYVSLAVGPGVFIPRPETELLVDAVLQVLRQEPDPVVVDLCAGSGALAVAIADEIPGATVVAVERSPQALAWLAKNTTETGVQVIAGDVRDPGPLEQLRGRVSAVVCNPPYVPEVTCVAPEVRADPAEAVFAGVDGLELMPAVIARATELLKSGGVFAVEHDESHVDALPALLFSDGGWEKVKVHKDLAARPRFTTAVRACGSIQTCLRSCSTVPTPPYVSKR
jgi:release factor glutamine methyltransferase